MKDKTTREKLVDRLNGYEATLRELSQNLGKEESEILQDIKHVQESLDDKDVLVREPKCKNCEFENFKNKLPSKCPECGSERITKAKFKIIDK